MAKNPINVKRTGFIRLIDGKNNDKNSKQILKRQIKVGIQNSK